MLSFKMIIGIAITFIGTLLIFDSRRIVKKTFPFGDENITTKGMKILGVFLALSGCVLCI